MAGKRQFSREATSAKLVSQFLSEMDGFAQANAGVLMLGATNVPWAVDPAFRRPGRFERVQFIPPPDAKARAAILTLHLAQRPVAPKLDVERIAARTSGCSGADLAHLVETAADAAIARALSHAPDTVIEQRDLEAAMEELKPTAQEWLTTARNHARYANESGQYDDVLAWLDKHREPVMPTELLYRIADEPRAGPLSRVAVNPFWPLMAMMLGGAWLGVPWFVVNAFAIGSATRWREVGLALGTLAGTAALFLALVVFERSVAIPKVAVPYLVLVLVVWKLGMAYVLQLTQASSFELFSAYGGRPANGVFGLLLAWFARDAVLAFIKGSLGVFGLVVAS